MFYYNLTLTKKGIMEKDQPKQDPVIRVLHVRITEEIDDLLREQIYRRRLTKQQIINEALTYFFQHRNS